MPRQLTDKEFQEHRPRQGETGRPFHYDDATLSPSKQRTIQMYRLYLDGHSYREIGEAFGISRQHVYVCFSDAGLRRIGHAAVKAAKDERYLREEKRRTDEIVESYQRLGKRPQIAAELGLRDLEVGAVLNELRKEGTVVQVLYNRQSNGNEITDEFLLAEILRAASIMGEPLARFTYAQDAARHALPADATIVRRFGSFAAACSLIGVRHNPQRGKRGSSFSPDDCVAAIQLCVEDIGGRVPTYADYDAWWRRVDGNAAKDPGTGVPGGLTIRNNFGTWRLAIAAALS